MKTRDDFQKAMAEELGLAVSQEKDASLKLVEEIFFGRHYHQKTEIQKQVIDPLFSLKNALIISATASGKTEATIVPIIARIIAERRKHVCIYIAPTKALLNDIIRRLSPYIDHLMIPYGIKHGDRKALPKNFNILFTTPESLDVILCRNEVFLSKVRHIIIDEVHQIFNTPRGIQTLLLIERIKKRAVVPLQRIALSATVSQPDELASWLMGTDSDVEVFFVGEQRYMNHQIVWLDVDRSIKDIVKNSSYKKILIFANNRRRCEDIFLSLKGCEPYRIYVHYSTLEREDRELVETAFKQSEFAVCVATSTLELGVDIGSVELVIFADPPESINSFLQRAGRGGRRSKSMNLFMLSESIKDAIHFGALISLASQNESEKFLQKKFYSAIVQQIFSYIAGKKNHTLIEEEFYELCKCLNWISEGDFTAILDNLVKKEYLNYDLKWRRYQMGPKLSIKYNRGMIHTNIEYSHKGSEVFVGNRKLANIPLPRTIQIGETFLFAGRFWKIIRIKENGYVVTATQPSLDPILPRWGGIGLPVSTMLAEEMRNILLNKTNLFKVLEECPVKERAKYIKRFSLEARTDNYIIEEEVRGYFIYYTFGGSILNSILKIIFISNNSDSDLKISNNEIALISNDRLNFGLIPDDTEMVFKIIQKNWRLFTSVISSPENFKILPIYLQQEELLSQIVNEDALNKLISYSSRKVMKANLGLISI